ncbi:MATE family efflux transporter [Parvularcula marina]|uniref:Multidrug export protein MepA n=2 Tax=Parvularcula marina TaxID=2292771 RepID=A0A371RJV9_9PROT|nr:MATE family efflux transporter [Parvularcula marina]
MAQCGKKDAEISFQEPWGIHREFVALSGSAAQMKVAPMPATAAPRRQNPYLQGSLVQLFLKSAAPIIAVMMVNGLLNIVDAIFLGHYVGADALSAVTMAFPLFMLLIALSSLVGSGSASLIARALGADDVERANSIFGSAQRLSLIISLVVLALYLLTRTSVLTLLSGGNEDLAAMASTYITPIYLAAPMNFILALQYDTFRSEGKIGLMTMLSAGITLLNVGFNFVLIVVLGLGVLGSALGTIAAQGVAFAIIVILRLRHFSDIRALPHAPFPDWDRWRRILALGLPGSLNFLGVSLMAGIIVYSIQAFAGEEYALTVAAYGIIQRIMTFAFFPILGLSLAAQAIVGNNYGAGAYHRSNQALVVALGLAVGFAIVIEAVFILGAGLLARMFVGDETVIAEVERILPIMVMLFVIFASNTILAGYFQALGDAGRAALFGLSQVYLFTIPLTLILPRIIGEWGIWIASPIAQASMAVLVSVTLFLTWRKTGRPYGVFVKEGTPPPQPGM